MGSRADSEPQWHLFRPAIWLVMLGVALALVVNVPLGVIVVGCAIGAAIRAERARRARF